MGTKRKASDEGIINTRTFDHHERNLQPLFSSYDYKIRPILNTVEKLQHLKVIQEGIPVPKVVVIGYRRSGKTSVLESLAGISLPRGGEYGICTRVPLIIQLKSHQDPVPDEFVLGYGNEKVKITDESQIPNAINKATVEIAGNSDCISNVPLTLVVKKNGVPDLTLIDLPGISFIGPPANIFQKISDIIMEYIEPEQTIILNVLDATQIIPLCESFTISQRVDSIRERTLAVVTRCDKYPDGDFIKKAMADAVEIPGLDYVCIRNRINDETFDEARIQEAKLFETHPLLSKLDKSVVGFPVLADKIVQIVSVMISKYIPNIRNKISEKLSVLILEHNKLPQSHPSDHDYKKITAFTIIAISLKGALQKEFVSGEIDEKILEDKEVSCEARLMDMLDNFAKELHTSVSKFSGNFLTEEIRVVEQTYAIRLPGYLPRSAFMCFLQKKVNTIANFPISFVNEVSAYLESVCAKVLNDVCGNYPKLLIFMRKLVQKLMAKMKKKLVKRVLEWIEMEKLTYFSCNTNVIASWKSMIDNNHEQFSKAMSSRCETINIEGYGMINVTHLFCVTPDVRNQAFELNMKMKAYWELVLIRMVDFLAIQLRFRMHEMVKKEMAMEIGNISVADIEHIMDEPQPRSNARERLQRSIDLLHESEMIVHDFLDDIREFQSNKQYT